LVPQAKLLGGLDPPPQEYTPMFTKLGLMSTQLSFKDTLLVIPFFKTKGKCEYCFDSIPLYYWLSTSWLLDKHKQSWQCKLHLKKSLRKALQDTATVVKNKFIVSTKGFKFLNLFRKQRKPN